MRSNVISVFAFLDGGELACGELTFVFPDVQSSWRFVHAISRLIVDEDLKSWRLQSFSDNDGNAVVRVTSPAREYEFGVIDHMLVHLFTGLLEPLFMSGTALPLVGEDAILEFGRAVYAKVEKVSSRREQRNICGNLQLLWPKFFRAYFSGWLSDHGPVVAPAYLYPCRWD